MLKVTNASGIDLGLAVWLLDDNYDYVKGVENYISVTTLMKPIRQIVLPPRIPPEDLEMDVIDFLARRRGHAFHDSIERSWELERARKSLAMLGYPDRVINALRINPTDEELDAMEATGQDAIPVYLEQRMFTEFEGFNIGGRFDQVIEGIVTDTKSTSVWGWVKGTRDDEHITQMSLYRWLDSRQQGRRKITEDFGKVNYVFTDWTKALARSTPNYPKQVETKTFKLWSLDETEAWVRAKLLSVRKHWKTLEKELPECTDEELWRSDPVFKFFADPAKATDPSARSTKNFPTMAEAQQYQITKGGRGVIVTVPGEVKACGYCAAFNGCTQKDRYL